MWSRGSRQSWSSLSHKHCLSRRQRWNSIRLATAFSDFFMAWTLQSRMMARTGSPFHPLWGSCVGWLHQYIKCNEAPIYLTTTSKNFPGGKRRQAEGIDGRWLRVRGRSAGAEGGLLIATLLCSRGSRTCLLEHSSLPGETFEDELIIARFDQVGIEVDPERIFGCRLDS